MDPQIESLRRSPCPICGQSEYEFGQIGGPGIQHFIPGTKKFWNIPEYSGNVPQKMLVRACLNCRNIQSFVRVFPPEKKSHQTRLATKTRPSPHFEIQPVAIPPDVSTFN